VENLNNEWVWDHFYARYDFGNKSGIHVKGHSSTHALSNKKALLPRKFLLAALTEED
jgi:hypothetical protein